MHRVLRMHVGGERSGVTSASVCVGSIVFLCLSGGVAHRNDLAFDPSGYTFVLLNNIFTTCNGEQV